MNSSREQEKRLKVKCLNSFYLKIIAVISMTIDHIGAVLLPQYLFLRIIGRLAFPIYCFLLVNGLIHTRNLKKYIGRLALFAIISEVFFDMTFFGKFVYLQAQNVFFTLLIGIIMLACINRLRQTMIAKYRFMALSGILEGIILVIACMAAYFLYTDYSLFGILIIYGFYALRNHKVRLVIFQSFINILLSPVEIFASIALIPIFLYNGEKGNTAFKWWFYIYYPLHLLVICIIKAAI